MREIKFRAWDKHIGCMRSWEEERVTSRQTLGHFFSRDDYAVMQFTDLHDKKGKDIYEGDVVRGVVKFPQLLTGDNDENCNFKMVGVVFWDAVGFRLSCMKTQVMCDPDRDGMGNYFDFHGAEGDTFEEMEVIGNIYENPDLNQAT